MIKKSLLIRWMSVLMVSLLFALFVGCSSKEEPETPVETPPAEEGEEEEEKPEETPGEEKPSEENTLSEEELKDLFGSGKDMAEIYYEMNVTGMDSENTISRMYLKGSKMRAESEVMGQTFVMIHGEDALYILDDSTKTAMKMPLGENVEGEQDTFTMDDFTSDVDETDMTYVGKEMLNGVSCHVVESTKLEEGYHVKMWLHEEYGFPMKMESYNKDGSEAFVMEVTDFKVGDLSDALFEVPEDYEIVDMGNLIPTVP